MLKLLAIDFSCVPEAGKSLVDMTEIVPHPHLLLHQNLLCKIVISFYLLMVMGLRVGGWAEQSPIV